MRAARNRCDIAARDAQVGQHPVIKGHQLADRTASRFPCGNECRRTTHHPRKRDERRQKADGPRRRRAARDTGMAEIRHRDLLKFWILDAAPKRSGVHIAPQPFQFLDRRRLPPHGSNVPAAWPNLGRRHAP
jgi:hypothetical protein